VTGQPPAGPGRTYDRVVLAVAALAVLALIGTVVAALLVVSDPAVPPLSVPTSSG
jgi:hypothetical protein